MTKNIFRKVNFSLLTISMISLAIFLWLSNNYKDNFILGCCIPLLVFSYVITIYYFFKERVNFENEIVDFSYIIASLKVIWRTDKSSILSFIFQEVVFISLIFVYNYGYFIIPLCIYTFTNFIETFIKKFDKKRIENI